MAFLSRTYLWRKLREIKIHRTHNRIAKICESLVSSYSGHPVHFPVSPKKRFETDRIIWQYWAQGFDNLPLHILDCMQSVDRYADDFQIIRLSDENLIEYLDIPDFLQEKKPFMSPAHFADVIRLMLLQAYGGIWMDATIKLTGHIPAQYIDNDFFVFRRDPNEPNYRYWRNVYAYYFGWGKRFRVNMLNSFIVAHKANKTVSELCDMLLLWWKDHNSVPDYFFFQILFDVYGCEESFPLVSDTKPHYLQQALVDPSFNIMTVEEIERAIAIHKLSFK